MMSKARSLLALPVLLFALLGCSGEKSPNTAASVAGEVTYENKPLPGGTITFHTDVGIICVAISPDGNYSATDLPVGEMLVTIETQSVEGTTAKKTYGGGYAAGHPTTSPPPEGANVGGDEIKVAYKKIPSKYANKNRSGLKATLVAGRQTQNFDLQGE